RSPATVENLANMSVFLPTSENILAFVYFVILFVTVKVPNAPDPFACILLSGITSRSKCANFSKNQKSCNNIGPLLPAVKTSWLFATGAPAAVVIFFFSFLLINSCTSKVLSKRKYKSMLIYNDYYIIMIKIVNILNLL